MKLTLLSCLVVLLSVAQTYPQQFYLKASGGYGIGTAMDVLTSTNRFQLNNVTENSSSAEAFSFGRGIEASIAAGYNLNSNIGFEMEFGYHKSPAVNYNKISVDAESTDYTTTELTAFSFNIIPSIVFRTEIYSVKPYLKIGPVLAFAGVDQTINDNYENKVIGFGGDFYIKEEFRGGIAFGVSSAIGIAYNIGSNVNLLFEINNKNMSYSPTEGEVTGYTVDGVTKLDGLADSYKNFSFKDKLDANEIQSSADQLKTEYPFSSLSFMLGVAVEL